jgi:hypothetical protein
MNCFECMFVGGFSNVIVERVIGELVVGEPVAT